LARAIGCRVAAALLLATATAIAVPGSPAAAEPDDAPPNEPRPLPTGSRLILVEGPWRPPLYAPVDEDWLQLTSGEWVRGTIEQIRADHVYFDSDELDDLVIDWSDVAELRSAKRNTYRFSRDGRDDVIVTGSAGMREGVIRIDTGSEVREFPSDALLAMIEGELREINYWSLDAGLGVTARSGNSDQLDTSIRVKLERDTPLTRGTLLYEAAYSVVESDQVTNNQRLYGEFAYYVSKRLFALLPTAEAYRDRLQNIELRTTVGVGIGYELVDRAKLEWDATLGAAYQRTDFGRVEPSQDDPAHDAAVIFGTALEMDPWKDVEWDTSYKLSLVVTDLHKTNHHLSSVFSLDIWGPLDLDVTFIFDRIEGPARDADGERPERNDYQLTVGLAVDL
jgi:hypothetical protein